MPTKRVMILTPFYYPNIGGAETFADELWKQARKRYIAWICTIKWKGVWKGINWLRSCGVAFDLFCVAFVDCFLHPHTVHALGFNAAFVAALLKPFFKFKLIVTPLALYDFDNKLLAALVRWTLRRTDLIFAESTMSFRNLICVAPLHKIKVFTHWVDTKRFYSVKKYENKRLKVLFAGRVLPEKGAHIIKQVEREMEGVDFIYAINIPNKNMPHYFQMADILVVPSLYAESPNRVVAEGAACGCVVIASNKGALPEQVTCFGISIEPTISGFKRIINAFDVHRKELRNYRYKTIAYAKERLTEKNAEVIINEY